MDLLGFKSIKGLAQEKDQFTQTLVNLCYGLAQEVNTLRRDLDALKKDTSTPKS